MRHALVFGATGQIGVPVVRRLLAQGWRVTAVSRQRRADEPGLHWLQGGFVDIAGTVPRVQAIVSCGPLDGFSRWYAEQPSGQARVIAFGSTSAVVKRHSSDPAERDIAERLQRAEDVLFSAARARDAHATVLRPTLVYGAARDATLSRIAGLARRTGWFPLPRRATGLRQPVHVDDLADAALACLESLATAGQVYELPGGESVPYREMVRRVLRALDPPARLVELPAPVFGALVRVARWRGYAAGFNEAMVDRMRRDLVFDDAPARSAFGYTPRPFRVTADMLPTGDNHTGSG